MKSKKKPVTNKELENRTNILMLELQKHSHAIDTLFMTIANYIDMNGHSDKVREYMLKQKKNEQEGKRDDV